MRRFALLLAIMLLALPARAAQITVPGDYATIALANTAAADGDTVWLATPDSTYSTSNLTIKRLSFKAVSTSPAKPRWCDEAANLAAFLKQTAGEPSFEDIHFVALGTKTTSFAYFDNCGATFTRCDFDNIDINAGSAGALYYHNASVSGDSLVAVDCTFVDCDHTGTNAPGGAVNIADAGKAAFRGCIFLNNSTVANGGAVYHGSVVGTWWSRYRDCLFVGNTCGALGATIYVAIGDVAPPDEVVSIQNCTFVANESATATGGQVCILEAIGNLSAEIHNSLFTGSTSVLALDSACDADSVVNCLSHDNRKDWFTGSAAYGDTIHVDPDYVTTSTDSARAYMPQACQAPPLASPRHTNDGGYMGYIQPVLTTHPDLLTPSNTSYIGNTTATTLTWNAVADADSYMIQWATSCGAPGSVDTTATNSLSVTSLTPDTRYYWRARTKECDGWGEWSGCFTFDVNGPRSTGSIVPFWRRMYGRH